MSITNAEIINRLSNDKFILIYDDCSHSGKLIELEAVKKLIEELK